MRDAAADELAAVGQADFAMEGVARRAFFSIGSVYSRWPDRDTLVADIAETRIVPSLVQGLDASEGTAESIEWLLGPGQEHVLRLGELLLAARTSPLVAHPAQRAWWSVRDALARRMSDDMAWYVATYAVGNALLGAIGVSGPNPARGRVAWFSDACHTTDFEPGRRTPVVVDVDVPTVPAPRSGDAVSAALISAAQTLLAEHGAAGTSTRDIASGAGVTTGALYRRYEGKSGLLSDVLLEQLQPDRYAWTWELVRALASDNPYHDAAAVIAARTILVASDEKAQAVLLQIGIAARNDAALQAQVDHRIQVAHRSRVEMAQQFSNLHLLRPDVGPDVLTWGFQAIPVGIRATQSAGIPLELVDVSASFEALLRAAAAPVEGP
ncbi:MAG: Bacterial regulatory protein tetR family [Actinomycetota bacterium]|jgi:AcrR family transcriptional regulator